MKTTIALFFPFLFLACIGNATQKAPNPDGSTVESSSREMGTAFCGNLSRCFPADFSAAYTSVADCVDRAIKKIPADTLGDPATCNQAKTDTCKDDLQAMACASSIKTVSIPITCGGC